MSKNFYLVYFPMKYVIFNLVIGLFIIGLGYFFNICEFSYQSSNILSEFLNPDDISITVTYYGYYVAFMSLVCFMFNMTVGKNNTKLERYKIAISLIPMMSMCTVHIVLSILVCDLLYSMLLLLPCVFEIATIIAERSIKVC